MQCGGQQVSISPLAMDFPLNTTNLWPEIMMTMTFFWLIYVSRGLICHRPTNISAIRSNAKIFTHARGRVCKLRRGPLNTFSFWGSLSRPRYCIRRSIQSGYSRFRHGTSVDWVTATDVISTQSSSIAIVVFGRVVILLWRSLRYIGWDDKIVTVYIYIAAQEKDRLLQDVY